MTDTEHAAGERAAGQRLDNFVDAAFAFAVTLLVIAGAEPLMALDDLRRALLRIPAFAIGFALIAMYWLGHRDFARLTDRRDGWTTAISLTIVFMVLVYVFPLRFLADSGLGFYSAGVLPGREVIASVDDVRWAFVIYGVGAALLSGLYVLLYHRVVRRGAAWGLPPAAVAQARDDRWGWIAVGGPPLLSVALSVIVTDPRALWIPGAAYWLVPVLIFGPRLRRKRLPEPSAP